MYIFFIFIYMKARMSSPVNTEGRKYRGIQPESESRTKSPKRSSSDEVTKNPRNTKESIKGSLKATYVSLLDAGSMVNFAN